MTHEPKLDELVQNVEQDRKVDQRQKWGLFVLAGLLFIASVVIGVMAGSMAADRDAAQAVAASEQTQKQEIAQDAQAAICTAADVAVYDETLCERLEAAASGPAAAVAGPKGDKGDQGRNGRDGRDGKDSTVPGPKGDPGNDSVIPGPAGLAGLNGKDSAVPGPAGPEGPVGPAGADGTNGADGRDGRGISSVTCEGEGENSYWVVTYTDGTTQTSTGPCRLTTLAPTEGP